MQNNWIDKQTTANQTDWSMKLTISPSLNLDLIVEILFKIVHLTNLSKTS